MPPAGYHKSAERSYTACEHLDFTWSRDELAEFRRLWAAGVPLARIAEALGRDGDEVAVLVLDQAHLGRIQPRQGGWRGVDGGGNRGAGAPGGPGTAGAAR